MMDTAAVNAWVNRALSQDQLDPLSADSTRQDVVRALGEPEAMGGLSRKQRTPMIYKYGRVEFHFGSEAADPLLLVVIKDDMGDGRIWTKKFFDLNTD